LGSASEAEYNDEDADEHSEIEVSEGGSDAEANEEDSNDAFNEFNDPELNDEE